MACHSQLESLRKRVFAAAKPKCMYGRALTGPMFATLVQEYCTALSDDKAPVIKNAWERVADQQCREAADAAIAEYNARLASSVSDGIALEADELLALHKQASKSAIEVFARGSIKVCML